MVMLNRAAKILIAVIAAAAPAAAQNAPATPPSAANPDPGATPPASDASNVVLAAKVPEPAPARDESGRAVSAKVAADIGSNMPKYAPPTPAPVVPADAPDTRDTDKPKNQIPRLPKYVVRESRPPVFRNRDLYTSEGLVNLSFKSHPGLHFGNILGLNSAAALEMYQDQQRLDAMGDLADEAHAMARGGDKAESDYILKESQATYMRPIDEAWSGPGGGGGFSGGSGGFLPGSGVR
jgi:hypothetical protein